MQTHRNQLTNRKLVTLSLLALMLLGAGQASAQVRVRAKVHTPFGTVRVSNHNSRGYYAPRRHLNYAISRHDKQIAKRLSRYTGVSKREILRLRRQGYRWGEVARWLDVSRQVVRAAKHKATWRRFLRDEQRYANHTRHQRRYNERCYFDD